MTRRLGESQRRRSGNRLLLLSGVPLLVSLDARFGGELPILLATTLTVAVALRTPRWLRGRLGPKGRLQSRYHAEGVYDVLDQLSYRDELTETWNERFLAAEFDGFAESLRKAGRPLHLALLELEGLEDLPPARRRELLRWTSAAFQGELYSRGHLFRTGERSFCAVMDVDEPETLISAGVDAIQGYAAAAASLPPKPALAVGLASVGPEQVLGLEATLALAREALAAARDAGPGRAGSTRMASRSTG